MPGVPRSLGCDACRKQKKKCDQRKPTCGRCSRLKISCVGGGVKRWKFLPQTFEASNQQAITTPKPAPSNEATRVTSGLVFILGISDVRYNVRACGGRFIPDLPRRLGSSPALDASVSALVAAYNSYQFKQPKSKALAQYGDALKTLRLSVQDPAESFGTRLYTVFTMYICQGWIDHKHSRKHREMLAYLLEEAVSQNRLGEIDPEYLYGLCVVVVGESLVNPAVKLGPWFWEASKASGIARPYNYGEQSFISLELDTYAEVSFFLRAPEKHLYQLYCIYHRIQLERPKLRHILRQTTQMAEMVPEVSPIIKMALNFHRLRYSILLSLGATLNRVIRIFSHDLSLTEESYDFFNEAILLAKQCLVTRPIGAAFIAELLKAIWVSLSDPCRCAKVEELLTDYQKDFEGAAYFEEAMETKKRLDRMEKRYTEAKKARNACTDAWRNDPSADELGGCTIL